MQNVGDLVGAISKGKGAKFCSFTYKAKGTGEVQKVTVILGASTEVLYKKDVAELEAAMKDMTGVMLLAATELLNSRMKSLAPLVKDGVEVADNSIGHNPAYTCEDVYVIPVGVNGGIKIHKETGDCHVVGLLEHKTVITPGEYKTVNSSPKTLAKNEISRKLPSARFRQYALGQVKTARLNGDVLELEVDY